GFRLTTLENLTPTLQTDITAATNNANSRVSKAGDTLSGAISWSGTPTDPTHLTTKAYVDNAIDNIPDVLPANGFELWVDSDLGDDVTGNGSITKPFQTIQKAIDEATAGGGILIHLMAGTFYGDVTVNKYAVMIQGWGTTDSQLSQIRG